MTSPERMTRDQVLAKLREEVAELRRLAETEPDPVKRADRLRTADSREAVIDEEADAIAAEIAESEQQTAISVRVPASLSAELKARAEAEQISTSTLVRRLLAQAVRQPATPVLTVGQVEEIARRVYRECA